MLVSIGQAARALGVAVVTLRRWDKLGQLSPQWRTPGGHRRYDIQRILLGDDNPELQARRTVCYARVSSYDQRDDLQRQGQRLMQWAQVHTHADTAPELITDLGSGLNDKKRGLLRLLKLVCENQVRQLIIVDPDRLLRFGYHLLKAVCAHHRTEVICLEAPVSLRFEEELARDVIGLMTSLCARLYGKRSHRNQRALQS